MANSEIGELTIDSDAPANSAPQAPWPSYDRDEIETVERVLRSGKVNYWTGDECRQFEREFADYCNSEHAIAVANGTVALELALEAAGIGPGDEVILPGYTCVMDVNPIKYLGAKPVYIDIEPDTFNMNINFLKFYVKFPACIYQII